MKKLYALFSLLVISTVTAIAQPTLTQANFVHNIGESTFYYLADTNTTTLNPTLGPNVVFDYTTVDALGVSQTDFYVDPSGTPGASDFPTADYCEKTNLGDTNFIYSKSNIDSLFTVGFIADITGFGVVTAKYDLDPETVMKFPFNYGNFYTDNYSGTFSTNYLGAVPVSASAAGDVTVAADAWGRLDLPFATSFDSVIRIRRVEHAETDTIFIGPPFNTQILPIIIDAIVVSYYKPSHGKSPILSFIEGTYQQDGAVIASNKTIACQYPLLTTDVKEYELSKSLNMYPNPTQNGQTVLSFNIENTANIKVELLNNLGQTITQVYQGKVNAGLSKFEINTTNLSSGVYFVNLLLDNTKITRKLIVE
tara:strand:- start:143 stop:1240 length:1098 start_codon:yes stop_codon:yes gene_type:complete